MRERWEDMPDVVEAAAQAACDEAHNRLAFNVAAYGKAWTGEYGDTQFVACKASKQALAAAVSVVPVVPVRVLRQWIEQERQLLAKAKPLDAHDRGFKVALDEVASVLNDYEKENPDA